MPLAEITHRAFEVLCRELGAVDTLRFINQFTTGHGDYTSERDVLFAEDTPDQILSEIKQRPPRIGPGSDGAEITPGC